jgi:4-diphosphocytidyl-2-C-methyl-D-erythritol kinase
MKRLRLRPHAKINLGLRILGRRPDGYHELVTRYQTVDLTDELEIVEEPEGLALAVEGAPLPADSRNLVLRAAQLLRQSAGIERGARMRLTKRIPIAAGLGGGSSDAAALLLGLDELWDLGLGLPGLAPLAAQLGADVPFFLHGGTARGTGRGDRIEPLDDRPEGWIVLILPGFASSTEEAYRAWDRRFSARRRSAAPEEDSLVNDFQELLEEDHPILARYRESLLVAGATGAALSGSGPVVFGLFDRREQARSALEGRDWGTARAVECRSIGRREYRRRLGLSLSD